MHKNVILLKDKILNILRNKDIKLYLYITCLSSLAFLSIYGIRILNPTYTDWLLTGGDLSQHYLGWKAYRASSWHIPIGMVDTLAYPEQTSIIFTDSIPIFAVVFKILSPILPTNFQYFGLWGICCFVLQGVLAGQIIKKFVNSQIMILIASILFAFTPVMIWRMFNHTALAAQWILLLGLEPIFDNNKYRNSPLRLYILVAFIGVLSASIHIYFVLMSGIIVLGICVSALFYSKRILKSILLLADYFIATIITVTALGGFTEDVTSIQGGGLGGYSLNINAFFNPQGWSCIYQDLPLYGNLQYEGFAYLGAGCLFLAMVTIVLCLGTKNVLLILKRNAVIIIPLMLIIAISIFVALSPVITYGNKLLISLDLPRWIVSKWSIFRASGRVAWSAIYILMLGCCICICRLIGRRTATIFLMVALSLQVYDIHMVLLQKHENFSNKTEFASKLSNETFWNYIAEDNSIKHIVYFSTIDEASMYSITDWAMDHDKTVSDFYFARSVGETVEEYKKEAFDKLDTDTLFIFTDSDKMWCGKYNLHYYEIDGFIIGYSEAIDGFPELNVFNSGARWEFGDNRYISENGGIDTRNGRIIYPNGLSYGPYWSVPSGNYSITVSGENISDFTEVVIQSGHGNKKHAFKMREKDASKIVVDIILNENVDDLEVLIKNNGAESVILKDMAMHYQ